MKPFYKLVLNFTAVGGLAFVTASAGCSDTSKSDDTSTAGKSGSTGGSSSQAGDTSKAGNPAAGDGVGGDPADTGGAGGAGGAGPGAPTVGKFCNTLSFGTIDAAGGAGGAGGADGAGGAPTGTSTDVTMVLEIGTGASKVKFEAITGTCAPLDGNACTTLPQGAAVPVTMYDKDDPTTVLDSGTAIILPGEDWIFVTDLDVNHQPIFGGGPLNTVACEDVTYQDVIQ